MAQALRTMLLLVISADLLFTGSILQLTVKAVATTPRMVDVNSIEDHCVKNVCRDFDFGNLTEVAVFNLKAKVRIFEEKQPPTYQLSSPLEYDTLIFENSTFAHFPLRFFYSLWVKELDMRNCSLERLTGQSFLMAGDLRNLLLSENRIERVEEMTFYHAKKLQFLFLDSNRIRSLVSESFKGLNDLKYLDLHDNRLEELPEGVFEPCPALQELNLAENRLSIVDDNTFSAIPNVLTLLLHRNRLNDISEFAFRKQRRLLLVDVSQNGHLKVLATSLSAQYLVAWNCSLARVNIYGIVRHVDLRHNHLLELYFSQPQHLESLDLSNNALHQISALARATSLRSLDLSDNPELRTLPDPWSLKSLEHLDLSKTGMSELPLSALLTSLQHLRFLNISHNHMRQINPLNFQYLENLTHFYIHANDWNCFNLRMVMDILIKPKKVYYSRDIFVADFPGEYIDGISCMYRLPDSIGAVDSTNVENQNYIILSESPQNNDDDDIDTLEQIKTLRKELKAIVSFYEEKFSKTFSMIASLQDRLREYEKLNNTMWQHVTITT